MEMVLIDPDELLDSNEVAELLGLSTNRAISVYRRRYPDFPQPVVTKGSGKCVLWRRTDIERWLEESGRGPS
jgi:glutathione-regulated potassium-efflux system ancillary protein KefG